MFENNVVNVNCEDDKIFLDAKSESIIHRFLTKQMIRILCLLWNCSLSNKEIADKMNLSSSALSNILQRMKKCEVVLLAMERKEKYIIYSLTPIAKEYAEKVLNVEEKSRLKIVKINEDETIELINCKSSFEKLKERLGDDWRSEFLSCCESYYQKDERGEKPEADAFFEAAEELIIKEQYIQLDSILDKLGDENIKKIYLKYVSQFKAIRCLCNLDDQNWKSAYQLIDDVLFNEKIYISCEFLEQSKEMSKDDIVNMAKAIYEIVENSKKKGLTKIEFLKIWNRYFWPHERLVYYLAEKYVNKYL